MATTRTKIKVDKEKLIKEVKQRQAEAKADVKNQTEEYTAQKEKWEAAAIQSLTRALEDAKKGSFPEAGYRGRLEVRVGEEYPVAGGADPKKYDHVIKMLEISPETTISLTTEDYSAYVK